MAKKKKENFNDLGLGSKGSPVAFRALNKDGSFNVHKKNVPFFERINFFHTLITMSWLRFNTFILLSYLGVNLVFASIYTLIGVEHLTGVEANSTTEAFTEAFFFSAQTVTTLGYGRVAPVGFAANMVAAIESMLGLLAFALGTGMFYGRFSRPTTKLKYSEHAVIAPYQNINGFMFRIVNPQSNQLLEVEVNISLSMRRKGTQLRNFFALKLERSKVNFLPYTWTVVHPIADTSPLFNLNEQQVRDNDAEFIVVIKAFDESSSQVVYSRSSYKATELKWGEKFVPIIQPEKDGMVIDVSELGKTQKAKLNFSSNHDS